MTTEKSIINIPLQSWATGRNGFFSDLSAINVHCFAYDGTNEAVQIMPVGKSGTELNAGFQLSRADALMLAETILLACNETALSLHKHPMDTR